MAFWRNGDLHNLQKLEFKTASDGVGEGFFQEMMACLQRMQDLRDVAISPYFGYELEEQGHDIFAPFSKLTRFAPLHRLFLEPNLLLNL